LHADNAGDPQEGKPESGKGYGASDAIDAALKFVECINRADLDGLIALMTHDHVFIDLVGEEHAGRETMKDAWGEYFSTCPEYMIHLSAVYSQPGRVLLVGRTTGSHLKQPRAVEFNSGTLIWVAEIEAGRLSLWRLLHDTAEARAALGIPGDDHPP